MAKLYFRYGAMNSGKSTALMQVAHNYEEQGMRVLILKPQVDTKGGGELVSRLGVRRRADLLIPPEVDVFEAVRAASAGEQPLACVLCDESQFFTPAQAEQLFMVTVDLNIPVICYGLRSDFSLKGFPGSTRLLELAHTIEEMKTICTCGRKATCNCRRVNGEFVFEGEQVAIDLENDVQYVSMCPQCYFKARRAFYAKRNAGVSISGSHRSQFFLHESLELPGVFYTVRACPAGRRFACRLVISVVSNANVFVIYQFTKQRYRHFFHMLYTTTYRQFRNKLQNHCNFRGSATLSRPVSMQSIQLCRLHSFSLQVYSFRQCRQIVANHKSNICSFFVCITSIYIFLFPIPFVIIFVYNEPCAVRPARCFLIY